jgi:hypothetical protein
MVSPPFPPLEYFPHGGEDPVAGLPNAMLDAQRPVLDPTFVDPLEAHHEPATGIVSTLAVRGDAPALRAILLDTPVPHDVRAAWVTGVLRDREADYPIGPDQLKLRMRHAAHLALQEMDEPLNQVESEHGQHILGQLQDHNTISIPPREAAPERRSTAAVIGRILRSIIHKPSIDGERGLHRRRPYQARHHHQSRHRR